MAELKHAATARINGSMSGSRPVAVLAEDEAIVRAAAADMLFDLGFEVLQAENAEGALQHLEAREGAALLYTDVNMPGPMDGCDLAHTVRARWPATRIIVCSGCTREEAALLPEKISFIVKPCAERVLRQAVLALRLN
ncbi:response regulator [Methylobacterium sp. NEAU K]|uniref:response regulator n=1 Tax=Methylobacterium sp. NEAU K TaxID=3064946 RepID=UPI002736E32D|nr:response regulator [Methylobacterium sp. NEAU K]MDP4004144.1 response regulator [Methylobacterium sp. NEAU K]